MIEKIKAIYTEQPNENFLKKGSITPLIFFFWLDMPLIRLMQTLKLKINPNIITLMGFPLLSLAGYSFFQGNLVIGAFFYYVYFILDLIDGKWARLINKTSRLGARLDYYAHIFGNIQMYFGIWYSQYFLKDNWLIGGSIIFIQYSIVISFSILIKKLHYKTFFSQVNSYYSFVDEAFGVFFVSTLFNIVNILFPLLVMLQFIHFMILFIRQKERPNIKEMVIDRLMKI